MLIKNTPAINLKKLLIFNFFIPVVFFVFVLCFMPIEKVFQFDSSDEGIELMKASLYSEGFSLYTQIWDDQPPLLTVILSYWFHWFGKSILAARLLVLSFSTLLVWSFCQTIRIHLGSLLAIIGTVLLVISCNFLRLSVSVMPGLPALALAMLSIYTLTLYKQKHCNLLLIISGSLLALSLQIKLFTAFMFPLMIFELLEFKFREQTGTELGNKKLTAIILWLVSLFAVFVLIGFFCNSLNYQQLVQTHLGQNVKAAFPGKNSLIETLTLLIQDFDYVLLAIVGVIGLFQKRQWEKCLPLVWLLVAIPLLLNHKPVWYHHYLLLSIPMTWLATYGIKASLNFFQQQRWVNNFKLHNIKNLTLSGFAAGFLVFTILVAPIKLAIIQLENHLYLEELNSNVHLVDIMLEHKKSTKWVFTDYPIYAFYSGLLVPPEIAVLSRIRVESGDITSEQLLSVFETYHPEQIVLGKFESFYYLLNSYIKQHYLKTYGIHSITHYLLKK